MATRPAKAAQTAQVVPAARKPSPLAEHCLELFAPLGAVRVQPMFGGWGFYLDGLFFALIAYERLFLKVDDTTRPRFAAAGSEAFVYRTKHRQQVSLGYWSAPADAMESAASMAPWASLGVQAALAARAAKPAKAIAAAARQPGIKTKPASKRAASPGAQPRSTSPSKPRRRA
jgi:DNA transformation protein and related proteins